MQIILDKATDLDAFLSKLKRQNRHEAEFHQAVREVAEKVIPFINRNPQYKKPCILERMTEPDRVISFRVCWEDGDGNIRVNRGYRVQFNNAIGPYKGGLRFDKSVSLSILKFLGFEQILKNSLTSLPMGGAKGGSDFNPKGKSDMGAVGKSMPVSNTPRSGRSSRRGTRYDATFTCCSAMLF